MPSNAPVPVRALSDAQLQQFVQDGFVRLDGAFLGSLPGKAAPSCGATLDATPMTGKRGRDR